jgi:serine phosphatase RsbU (regulator of sigma subunit)
VPVDRVLTAVAVEFDLRAGVLTIANAAHVPPLIRRGVDGLVAIAGHASGPPLGLSHEAKYVDEHYELNQGDLVVLMTDGVLEAVEPDLLGMRMLTQLVSEASEGADAMHRSLLQRFEECTTGKRADDMTLMVVEATPEPISGHFLDVARTVETCAC